MPISRMLQPRQNYGLGSFVKKAVGKVTKPITKLSKKIVPKEIAGIMRVAAPFLPPGYREAAYLMGTARQTGRISPLDLALTAAPSIGRITLPDEGRFAKFVPEGLQGDTIKEALGKTPLPFTDKNLSELLVGKEKDTRKIMGRQDKYGESIQRTQSEIDRISGSLPQADKDRLVELSKKYSDSRAEDLYSIDPSDRKFIKSIVEKPAIPTTIYEPETSGIFGKGEKMFTIGEGVLPGTGDVRSDVGILDTKAGQTLFGKETKEGQFKPDLLKIGGLGLSAYDYIKTAKSAEEAGQNLVDATGDPDSYQIGYNIFADLQPSAFDIPEQFRLADGGRVNYALGSMPTTEESGLGGLPIEADMRYTGGFMPYGAVEKADDVPARLSKNEFVFTADAVRAAGGGSVQKGAQKMYNTMKQLESQPEAKGMMA